MSTCDALVPYINNLATINNSDWGCDVAPKLPPLNITVKMDEGLSPFFHITLTAIKSDGTTGSLGPIMYTYYINNLILDQEGFEPGTLYYLEKGLSLTWPNGSEGTTLTPPCRFSPNAAITTITLGNNIPTDKLNPSYYQVGDSYTINILFCAGPGDRRVYAQFTPAFGFSLQGGGGGGFADNTTNSINCSTCQCLMQITPTSDKKVQTPQIYLSLVSDIENTQIGQSIFWICDKYTYYLNKKLGCNSLNTCQTYMIYPEEVKQTKFSEYGPDVGSVMRGKGRTMYDKATYLFSGLKIGVTFPQFYNNLAIYSMARYIISRILYGTFNIHYLLGKYYEKFLKDLGNSRFCNYLNFFVDPEGQYFEYHKYFKNSSSGIKHPKSDLQSGKYLNDIIYEEMIDEFGEDVSNFNQGENEEEYFQL